MFKPNVFRFDNLQLAWEGLNDYLLNNEEKIKTKKGGTIYGTEMVLYDNVIYAETCNIDPNFDFGRVLGYTDKKWSKLLKNYIDYNYLELVASEIQRREKTANPHYNYTFHFANKYGSGKDCLISITFSRRYKNEPPTLTFNTRASEVTKRLIFDFLLIQRIAELVYGENQKCKIICHIAFMFINLECSLMYVSWKGLEEAVRKGKKTKAYSNYQERVIKKYNYFLEVDLEKITFKVSQRAAAQVQKDEKGYPVRGCKKLLASNLTLYYNHKYKVAEQKKLNESLTIK